MKYIDSEIILQRKIEPLVYVYIMIIIVIMLSLIIFFILFHYKTYYNVRGIVMCEDSYYYIRIYVPLDNLKYITDNDIVKIDDLEYKYSIIEVDSEYFTDNVTTYQIMNIEIDLKDKYKFNNLTLDMKFVKEDQRIIDYILE